MKYIFTQQKKFSLIGVVVVLSIGAFVLLIKNGAAVFFSRSLGSMPVDSLSAEHQGITSVCNPLFEQDYRKTLSAGAEEQEGYYMLGCGGIF